MADRFLTLLDLTKMTGNDSAVGVVDEVNIVAPELATLMGRPIPGLSYKVSKRVALPHSGGSAFRRVNEGADIGSTRYDQILGECFFLDGQLQVDEALVDQGVAEGRLPEDILASEAANAMEEKTIQVGDQFYRGTTPDANGFVGIQGLYDATNCEVDATGTPGSATSAWLVFNDIQGVHWVFGKNGGLIAGDWTKQQVTAPTGGKKQMAFVNNVKGWLGLANNHTHAIVRIKNLTTASGKGLTDALVMQALTKVPIAMRQQRSKWKLFINSAASLQLQNSRSVVVGVRTANGGSNFAEEPTESQGAQIVLTDSIRNDE